MSIVTALHAWSEATVRPVHTLAPSNPIRITTVTATATPTLRDSVGSEIDAGDSVELRRTPRRTAADTNARTIVNTAAETHSIRDHRR